MRAASCTASAACITQRRIVCQASVSKSLVRLNPIPCNGSGKKYSLSIMMKMYTIGKMISQGCRYTSREHYLIIRFNL